MEDGERGYQLPNATTLFVDISMLHMFIHIRNINRRVKSRKWLECIIQARREKYEAATLCGPVWCQLHDGNVIIAAATRGQEN